MPRKARANVYDTITDKVIADLERGELTWFRPWEGGDATRPLRWTGEAYNGVNVLALWFAALEKGYQLPHWMTYKQAQELGGQVRGGEKGSHVVYGNSFVKMEKDESGEEVETRIPFLKTYSVFNAEQIDDLPDRFYARPAPTSPGSRIEGAERFFAATGAEIKHGGSRAFYNPDMDVVQMPPFERFHEAIGYYGTLAHEMTHWTGHPTRLARDFSGRFGSESYAMEELVAQLGAAFLCADLELTPQPREDIAAYIQSWLKVLKEDNRAVFTAASAAQKAADFLHEMQRGQTPDATLDQLAQETARQQDQQKI